MASRVDTLHNLEKVARQAMAVIREEHTDCRLTPEQVARRLYVSRRQLFRSFEMLGYGFADVLARVRARTAMSLLHDLTMSIREVAERSGFGSDDSLQRHFRRLVGCSPCDYRRRVHCEPQRVPDLRESVAVA